MDIKVDMENVVIEVPIEVGPSSSGKTTLIASTHGYKPGVIEVRGKNVDVMVSVNVYTKAKV